MKVSLREQKLILIAENAQEAFFLKNCIEPAAGLIKKIEVDYNTIKDTPND